MRDVRLHLVAKVTYYLGWIALVCGGLVHFRVAEPLFDAINVTKRNLFEASVVCFLISWPLSSVRSFRTKTKCPAGLQAY